MEKSLSPLFPVGGGGGGGGGGAVVTNDWCITITDLFVEISICDAQLISYIKFKEHKCFSRMQNLQTTEYTYYRKLRYCK